MASAQFIKYVTANNDRWDLIADRMYGDATAFAGIIAANPSVSIYPVLPFGIPIFVPIIAPKVATTPLPPWTAAAQAGGQLG